MELMVICCITFLISTLTFLSGFGLSTVLVPLFAFFFPLPLSIAATAIIHLLNNIFQLMLIGKFASLRVIVRFGVPAALAAIVGAYFMVYLSAFPNLASSNYLCFDITFFGIVLGLIVIISALFVLMPKLSSLAFPARFLPIGGLLAGFFGGLSGHQGIFRSAFLIKAQLDKKQFISTSIACSTLIDLIRVSVYGLTFLKFKNLGSISNLLIGATLSAFLGSYLGSHLLHRTPYKIVRLIVGIMLLCLGIALIFGIGKC